MATRFAHVRCIHAAFIRGGAEDCGVPFEINFPLVRIRRGADPNNGAYSNLCDADAVQGEQVYDNGMR